MSIIKKVKEAINSDESKKINETVARLFTEAGLMLQDNENKIITLAFCGVSFLIGFITATILL